MPAFCLTPLFPIRIMINFCEYATMLETERRAGRGWGGRRERVNDWKCEPSKNGFAHCCRIKFKWMAHMQTSYGLVHTKLDVANRSCIYFSGIHGCSSWLKNRLDANPHVPPIRRLRINIVSANIIKYGKYREWMEQVNGHRAMCRLKRNRMKMRAKEMTLTMRNKRTHQA